MMTLPQLSSHRAPSARLEPAIGPGGRLSGPQTLLRVGLVLALLLIFALARALTGSGRAALPFPANLRVQALSEGVYLGEGPSDADLVAMHETAGLRAVVDVGDATVEERATARGLKLTFLPLSTTAQQPPSAEQVARVAELIQGTTRRGGRVYVHGEPGSEPAPGGGSLRDQRAVVVGCMLRLLHGESLGQALGKLTAGDWRAMSDQQANAIRDLAAALEPAGTGPARAPGSAGNGSGNGSGNPYRALRGVSW